MSQDLDRAPVTPPAAPAPAPAPAPGEAGEPRRRILVVDDDRSLRRLAGQVLTTAGYEVQLAGDGQEALTAFQSGARPDLVLLDVVMPGMDGFETLARLRQLPGGAETLVVFVTGLADLSSVQRAIESGADDFVSKPFDAGELLMRIRALFGRRTAERRSREGPLRETMTTLLVHDLKHPLTTIYFNAGLLRRDPELPRKAQDKVRRILRASETLENMILSILDVTRSEQGALPIRPTRFDLFELLQELTATMGAQAELNGQRLEVSTTGARRVRADRDLVRRALENLIDNATSYAPSGTAIRVEAIVGEEAFELRVRDEGPGVPVERRREVFEKYVQSHREGVRGRKGRGLGLVFVRIAAEAHGGGAWIEDLQSGSCFCIRVPQGADHDEPL